MLNLILSCILLLISAVHSTTIIDLKTSRIGCPLNTIHTSITNSSLNIHFDQLYALKSQKSNDCVDVNSFIVTMTFDDLVTINLNASTNIISVNDLQTAKTDIILESNNRINGLKQRESVRELNLKQMDQEMGYNVSRNQTKLYRGPIQTFYETRSDKWEMMSLKGRRFMIRIKVQVMNCDNPMEDVFLQINSLDLTLSTSHLFKTLSTSHLFKTLSTSHLFKTLPILQSINEHIA